MLNRNQLLPFLLCFLLRDLPFLCCPVWNNLMHCRLFLIVPILPFLWPFPSSPFLWIFLFVCLSVTLFRNISNCFSCFYFIWNSRTLTHDTHKMHIKSSRCYCALSNRQGSILSGKEQRNSYTTKKKQKQNYPLHKKKKRGEIRCVTFPICIAYKWSICSNFLYIRICVKLKETLLYVAFAFFPFGFWLVSNV